MSESTWTNNQDLVLEDDQPNRLKFAVLGGIMILAIVVLVVNALRSNTQQIITVDEYFADAPRFAERDVRVAGWVVPGTVQYTQIDAETSRLEFEVVDSLEAPTVSLHIVAMNEPKPDLLEGEAQAVAIGRAGDDGSFYVNPDGLLLKCPTRYEELDPAGHQAANGDY